MPTNEESIVDVAANEVDLDVDALFDVLTSPRRRYVLARLQQCTEPVALTDLATEVGAWELDGDVSDVPEAGTRAIHVSLHHTHVPKMAAAGLVEYDRHQQTIAPTPAARELVSLAHLPRI